MFNLILKYTQSYKIKINFGSLFIAFQSTAVKSKYHMTIRETFIHYSKFLLYLVNGGKIY